jgi:hypothetical protein
MGRERSEDPKKKIEGKRFTQKEENKKAICANEKNELSH